MGDLTVPFFYIGTGSSSRLSISAILGIARAGKWQRGQPFVLPANGRREHSVIWAGAGTAGGSSKLAKL